MTVRFSNQLVAELYQPFWAAWQAGEFLTDASAVAGTHRQRGLAWLRQAGGVRPRRGRNLQGRYLSFAEREEIALARVTGESMRSIAARLGRSPSTISRELARIAALVYRAAPPPTTDPKALVGIDWQLTVMAGAGPDATASTPAAPAAVRFDGKGHLSGSDGCNSMGGNVTITPGHLDDVAIGGTLMECPGARHDQYTLMLSVLRGSSIWDIVDGQLTITKAGVGSLSWHAAPGLSPTSPRS